MSGILCSWTRTCGAQCCAITLLKLSRVVGVAKLGKFTGMLRGFCVLFFVGYWYLVFIKLVLFVF